MLLKETGNAGWLVDQDAGPVDHYTSNFYYQGLRLIYYIPQSVGIWKVFSTATIPYYIPLRVM